MTLEELLAIPPFKDLQLLAGKSGLRHSVSTVTVLDSPDGAAWVRGDELVLTSGYALSVSGASLTLLLEELSDRGSSGLAIKTKRFLQQIPREAIDLANRLGFPIISIPDRFAFSDIIHPALSVIVDRQSKLLQQAAEIRKMFLERAVSSGSSMSEIMQTLSTVLGKASAFVDLHFKRFYCSNYGSKLAKHLQSIGYEDFSPAAVSAQYDCYPVSNNTETLGYILTEKSASGEADQNVIDSAIEYAGLVLVLRIQSRISNQRIEEKYRDAFLEDLLQGRLKTETEIHNRAQLYGWDFSQGGLVAIMDISTKRSFDIKKSASDKHGNAYSPQVFEHAISAMLQVFPDAKYCKQTDRVVFLISSPDHKSETLQTQLEEIFMKIDVTALPITLSMGVGDYWENILDITEGYSQAVSSLNLCYRLGKAGCVMFFNHLGIYRLLATTATSRESIALYTRYIQPLLEYDAKHRSNLFVTLETIVGCGWNLTLAAEQLFIHYNSVKYRIAKICEMIDLDFHSHEQCLLVEIALKIYLINGSLQ